MNAPSDRELLIRIDERVRVLDAKIEHLSSEMETGRHPCAKAISIEKELNTSIKKEVRINTSFRNKTIGIIIAIATFLGMSGSLDAIPDDVLNKIASQIFKDTKPNDKE